MCGGNDATRRIQGKSRSEFSTVGPISQCMLLWVGTTVAADVVIDVCMQPERNERDAGQGVHVCAQKDEICLLVAHTNAQGHMLSTRRKRRHEEPLPVLAGAWRSWSAWESPER